MSNFFIDNTGELEQKYSYALELAKKADTLSDIQELISLLHLISPYKNSLSLLGDSYSLLENEQKYQKALWIMERAESSDDFKRLCDVLNSLGKYKDSRTLLSEAQKLLEKSEEEESLRQRKKILASVLCAAAFMMICFGWYKLKVWRDRLALEEAERIAAEEARIKRNGAMRAFFEGSKDEAILSELNEKSPDIVYLDMLAILRYGEGGRTYYSLYGKNNIPRSQVCDEALELAGKIPGAQSEIFLADMYFAGQIVSQDTGLAVKLYSGPAESGDTYAVTALAEVYEFRKDYDSAQKWYTKAYELGNAGAEEALEGIKDILKYIELSKKGDPEAQHKEGQAYQDSKEPENLKKSFNLFSESAKKGYAPAIYSLGKIYHTGNSEVSKDIKKAANLYQQSAEKGYAPAQFTLAEMYENGEGVPQDYSKAVSLYQKAATQNYPQSLMRLRRIYYEVRKDYKQALKYYIEEAGKGNNEAQYYAGLMYENLKDYEKASEFYSKSFQRGNNQAYKALQRISGKIPVKMSVKGTKINLRSQPGVNSEVKMQLDEGTPVDVLEKSSRDNAEWLLVRLQSGQRGWMSGSYVMTRIGDTGSHGKTYRAVKGYDVNLRTSYTRNSGSVAKLNDGNIVEVFGKHSGRDGTWYQVYTLSGKSGWIFEKYIRNRQSF